MSPLALVLLTFLAFPLAFLAGRLRGRTPRLAALLAILALPILVYTILFLGYGAGAQGQGLHWWVRGLTMLGLPLVIWFFIAIGGFALGLTSRRPSA